MLGYFEDIKIGEGHKIGTYKFTEENIVAFATKFDPQYFHTDREAAKDSIFNGLSASGWQTVCVWMGLWVRAVQERAVAQAKKGEPIGELGASSGYTDLRWIKAVLPGDTLTFHTRNHEKRNVEGKPKWGCIVQVNEAYNQKGELVFSFMGQSIVRRRSPQS